MGNLIVGLLGLCVGGGLLIYNRVMMLLGRRTTLPIRR